MTEAQQQNGQQGAKNNPPPPIGSDAEKEAARLKAEREALANQPPTASSPVAGGVRRSFDKTIEKFHDLFKLKVNDCLKNISYNTKIDLHKVEHIHFFHTIDSHGFIQEYSSPVAGHMHKVRVEEKAGVLTAICEAAVREIEKKTPGGKVIKDFGRVHLGENETGEQIHDDHKHEVEYIRSEKLTVPAN